MTYRDPLAAYLLRVIEAALECRSPFAARVILSCGRDDALEDEERRFAEGEWWGALLAEERVEEELLTFLKG